MSMILTEYTCTVAFSDTDMAGVVHFTSILRYVENAEHAALAELGIPVISKEGGVPKVHVECDYKSPLRFGDEVSVQMVLDEVSNKSLKWSFSVKVKEKIAATGKLVTAMVNAKGESSDIPQAWRDLLNDN